MANELLEAYDAKLDRLLTKAEDQVAESTGWLRALRSRGLAAHLENGIPTPKHEEWKYTPLRALTTQQFEPALDAEVAQSDVDGLFFSEGVRVVLVNGRFKPSLSNIPDINGLALVSLKAAIQDDLQVVKDHLGQIALIESHTFAALNTAIFEDGVLLQVGKSAIIEPLIEIVHVSTESGGASAPRLVLVAEANSAVRVIETFVTSGAEKCLTLPVTEAFIGPGAVVEHVKFQIESPTAYHVSLWQAVQARDSDYRAYNIVFGGAIARTDQNVVLDGEGITTRMDGVVVATGEQLIDNHTRLDHAKPNCNSFEIYKQIIDDKAACVFNGKIFVHLDAQKTDAKQTNKALLLSKEASINSKPQLEIFADDVKCTHGATVGQLDDQALFYLQSRGIPKAEAEAMLVYAFAAEVVELIGDEQVKQGLEKKLFEKLIR